VAFANTEVLCPLALHGDADLMPISAVENAIRLLYCALYGRKDFVGNLDELRCHLFVTKKGDLCTLSLQRMRLSIT
jgi:hypothetical protein